MLIENDGDDDSLKKKIKMEDDNEIDESNLKQKIKIENLNIFVILLVFVLKVDFILALMQLDDLISIIVSFTKTSYQKIRNYIMINGVYFDYI